MSDHERKLLWISAACAVVAGVSGYLIAPDGKRTRAAAGMLVASPWLIVASVIYTMLDGTGE